MFTEQSDSIYQNKKYSQTEIRDRIQQLINKNNKPLSETSMNT
jgi:DNA-directed RNA polymerase specialized sigma54-like protein